jgi:hypothetical protein
MLPSRVSKTDCEICNNYNASIEICALFAIPRKGVLLYMKMLMSGGIYLNKNVEKKGDQEKRLVEYISLVLR